MTATPTLDFTHVAVVEDIAAELKMSISTLRELCRRGEFPNVRLSGRRRVLIDRRWVQLYLEGTPLETKRLPGGGRICKPIARTKGANDVR